MGSARTSYGVGKEVGQIGCLASRFADRALAMLALWPLSAGVSFREKQGPTGQ